MKIRIPKFIGRKMYFKFRKWQTRNHIINPVVSIESKFYTRPMKTRNYDIVPSLDVKFYINIRRR